MVRNTHHTHAYHHTCICCLTHAESTHSSLLSLLLACGCVCRYCFIFVIFAVAEFATVHHILYSKAFPAKLAWLIDDFCAYTLAVVWLLSNLLAWPPLLGGSDVLYGLVLLLDVAYLLLNVYRFYWNWKEDKKGVALYKHWWQLFRTRWFPKKE